MLVTPGDVTTMTFGWGSIKWFVTPHAIEGASSSLGEVIVNPGLGTGMNSSVTLRVTRTGWWRLLPRAS